MFTNNERQKFLHYFNVILEGFQSEDVFLKCDACVLENFKKCFEYNVGAGKNIRGILVTHFFDVIKETGGVLYRESDNDPLVLGWIIEMLQATFLILDDIMDMSFTRRGMPCWYKKEDIGLMAINDAEMIQSYTKVLLKKHFKDHPKCFELLCLINEVEMVTTIGQSLDMHMCIDSSKEDYSKFSQKKSDEISWHKTFFYSFYFPFMFALNLFKDSKLTDQDVTCCVKVLELTGILFQIQDDYLDCFGCHEITGKIGTDIIEGKCTWLAGTAISLMNPQQLNIFKKFYGKDDQKAVNEIKNLYKDLQLESLYEEKISSILESIQKINYNNECAVLDCCKKISLNLMGRFK